VLEPDFSDTAACLVTGTDFIVGFRGKMNTNSLRFGSHRGCGHPVTRIPDHLTIEPFVARVLSTLQRAGQTPAP
jgi:hypothetical protein